MSSRNVCCSSNSIDPQTTTTTMCVPLSTLVPKCPGQTNSGIGLSKLVVTSSTRILSSPCQEDGSGGSYFKTFIRVAALVGVGYAVIYLSRLCYTTYWKKASANTGESVRALPPGEISSLENVNDKGTKQQQTLQLTSAASKEFIRADGGDKLTNEPIVTYVEDEPEKSVPVEIMDVTEEEMCTNSKTSTSTVDETKVILLQVLRGFYTPSITPDLLELETFLRIAKLDYNVKITDSLYPDDNSSYLTLIQIGTKEIPYNKSEKCIKYLISQFGVDLDKKAGSIENESRTKSQLELVKCLLDNQIQWAILLWRWVFDERKSLPKIVKSPTLFDIEVMKRRTKLIECKGFKYFTKLSLNPNKLQRPTIDEIFKIALEALDKISIVLERKLYFYGETPGTLDCKAFALLTQMIWNMPNSPFENCIKNFPNLVEFVLRIKSNYWPDWDDLISQPRSNDPILVNVNSQPSASSSNHNLNVNSSPGHQQLESNNLDGSEISNADKNNLLCTETTPTTTTAFAQNCGQGYQSLMENISKIPLLNQNITEMLDSLNCITAKLENAESLEEEGEKPVETFSINCKEERHQQIRNQIAMKFKTGEPLNQEEIDEYEYYCNTTYSKDIWSAGSNNANYNTKVPQINNILSQQQQQYYTQGLVQQQYSSPTTDTSFNYGMRSLRTRNIPDYNSYYYGNNTSKNASYYNPYSYALSYQQNRYVDQVVLTSRNARTRKDHYDQTRKTTAICNNSAPTN